MHTPLENGVESPEFVASATTSTPPEEVARQIREALAYKPEKRGKLGDANGARAYLVEAIERAGVMVVINGIVGSNTRRPLNLEECRGVALVDSVAPLLFVNGADTKHAQIFTLIHETAHVYLGHSAF